jgi:N-methylhydantoinase B
VGREAARSIYGVVLHGGAVDAAATAARRLEMRTERVGHDVDAAFGERRDIPRSGAPLGEYVQLTAGGPQCTWCAHALAPAGADWKDHAALSRVPVSQAGPHRSDDGFVLIRACCPSCGTLLDVDLALGDDPPLHDRVEGR